MLPVDKLPAFFVHHLPNKNWWQRSECAVTVDELFVKVRAWQRRFDAGDRSFVCGRYWDDSWCQKDVQVIPAAERQKLFNTKGSCLAWRNRRTNRCASIETLAPCPLTTSFACFTRGSKRPVLRK